MTNDDLAEKRLSKFSSADRRAYSRPKNDAMPQHPSSAFAPTNNPPLADLLEHAIRGGGLPAREAAEPNPIHERLIEELTTAREQIRAEPEAQYVDQVFSYMQPALDPMALEEAAPDAFLMDQAPGFIDQEPGLPTDLAPAMQEETDWDEPETAPLSDLALSYLVRPAMLEETSPLAPDTAPLTAAEALEKHLSGDRPKNRPASAGPAKPAKTVSQKARSLMGRMRLPDWNRRRRALLTLIHRRLFDSRTEELLFCKTPPFELYRIKETERGLQKDFSYQGPVPRKLLDWALSALPADLKQYAFVDFRAGNGRTLLLAAERNFEYAAGYAFDVEGAGTLEMNLARYPRVCLTCRDVRALRGDRDGVQIPSQPCVLFFPDSLSAGHLDIILDYLTVSLKVDPRPVYLIFENAGRESGKSQMSVFKKAPLPLLNQAKAFFFAPVSVAVYRSRTDGARRGRLTPDPIMTDTRSG